MDAMGDILKRLSVPGEPAEITLIKQFIQDNFNEAARVSVNNDSLIISVHGASLANTLRLRIVQLQKFCKTDKRLVFRIH